MIPRVTTDYEDLIVDFEIVNQNETHTYKLDYENDRVIGWTDEQEAMKQVIYKILNTERYGHVIYSDNYGVELHELIGEHIAYVIPETERRIREGLMWDERITSVFDFDFEINKKQVDVTFKCNTIFGEIPVNFGVEF